jgi:Tol biopolymer transport system component
MLTLVSWSEAGRSSAAQGGAVPGTGEIAFVGERSGTADIYTMDARGGAERALTRNRPTASAVDWSPDGRFAFMSWDLDVPWIWTAAADGGSLRRLVPGENPAWSPDGRSIAFGRSTDAFPAGIYVMTADGRNVRRVASTGVDEASQPSWSPDGQALVFATLESIRTVELSSGRVRVIRPEGDYPPPEVSWSPDGSLIAFAADFDVFVTTPVGTATRRLTRTPNGDPEYALAWRPDGTLTFLREQTGSRYGAYSIRPDGGGLRRLFSTATDDFPRLDWSRDGDRAVVSSAFDDTVFVIRPDGSGKRAILVGDAHTGPAWSPRGTRLAVAGSVSLLLLDARGALHPVRSVRCAPPISWAPDGKRLVCDAGDGGDVLLVALEGLRARQRVLLRDRGIGDPTKSDADWSPDGRRLVYVADGALALFDFARPAGQATNAIPIREPYGEASGPNWSPDGRRLVFAASCAGADPPCRAGIFTVSVDGRGLRRVSPSGLNPEWSPDGGRLAFDDARRGNRDIYAVNADGTHRVRLTSAPGADSDATWRRSR